MPDPRIAPYGSWKSPVTSDLIVAGTVGLGEIALDGQDIYWVEMRPTEGGRSVVVRRTPDGRTADVTPPGFNARTRVHEYGGGALLAARAPVYFSNFGDHRLYRQAPGASPHPLTPPGAWRYADGVIDRRRGLMIWVREDHTDSTREAVNTLVGIELAHPSEGRVLVSGNDFYSDPRLSPDGASLAWLTWRHPNMPWDGTECWVAPLRDDGTLGEAQRVGVLDEETRRLEILEPPYSEISSPQAGPGYAVMVAGSPTEAPAIVRVELNRRRRDVLRRSSQVTIDPGYLSIPEAIEFPTE